MDASNSRVSSGCQTRQRGLLSLTAVVLLATGPALASDPAGLGEIEVVGGNSLSSRDVNRVLGGEANPDRVRGVLENLGDRLLEDGLLEAELTLRLRSDGKSELEIVEQEVAKWETLRVRVRADSAAASAPPRIERGDDFESTRFERILFEWVADWAEEGYPFATATIDSLTVREGRVRAGVRCQPGPRVVVDSVSFPGRTTTKATFLEKWIRFQPERAFRQSSLETRRRRLEQTGLFLSVGQPLLQPLPGDRVRIHFPVEETKHNRLEGAVGFAGESETVSGFAAVELGNLFGTGRRLGIRWERLEAERTRFDLQYREPIIFGLPVAGHVLVSQQVQDTTYTLDRSELTAEISIGFDLGISLGGEWRRSVLGPEPSEVIRRFSSIFGAEWNELSLARWQGGRVRGTFRTGNSEIVPPEGPSRSERLDRFEVDLERFARSGWGSLLRIGGSAGGLSGDRTSEIPPSEALWIGGAATLRGYPEQAFATRRYGLVQFELGGAILGARGRAYGFVDAAWFRRLQAGGDAEERVGWGVGMNALTAGQSLSLDFGIPGADGFSEVRIHLRLQTLF